LGPFKLKKKVSWCMHCGLISMALTNQYKGMLTLAKFSLEKCQW